MGNKNETFNESEALRLKSALDLYENAPCGSVSFQNDGLIVAINNTLANWLGYKKSEIVKLRTLPSLFKIGGQIYFETHFFPLIKMQGFIQEVYFDIIRKDKSVFNGLINVREIPSHENFKTTYQATILDVSDRHKYENEILEAKRKAEADSNSKAEFLATISHEIRTPLNAILGIGNLLHNTPLNENQKEYARLLLSSSEHLLSLVNNLLDLSKIEAKKLELEYVTFNLFDHITLLQQIYAVKAHEKGIELLLELDELIPENIIGDPVKLNQILTNLVGNAIKFTKQGSITVAISINKKTKNKVNLLFEVIDTGIGIPEEKLETIFQEFSQASYDVGVEYGGTGLGLTISKKLIELQGSQLNVSSKLNEGSIFSFDLNYAVDSKPNKNSADALNQPDNLSFGNYQVLVVDDHYVNIFITAQYLDQWKIEYKTANSGSEALDIIEKHPIDIVLLDLQMPQMNGYETAEKIRELGLETDPIIIAFSATTKGEVQGQLIEAGIDDHLSKPFQPLQLYNLLKFYYNSINIEEVKSSGQLAKVDAESKKLKKLLKPKTPSPAVASFNLDQYIKMANNKPEFLKKFVVSTLEALVEYQKDFERAIIDKDPEILSNLLHKSTMTLYYIKADKLTELMKDICNLMEVNDTDPAIVRKVDKCKKEFSTITKGLEKSIGH